MLHTCTAADLKCGQQTQSEVLTGSDLNLSKHIKYISETAFVHLRNIKVRPHIAAPDVLSSGLLLCHL